MSTALERLKKKADANSSGTKKREVEIQSSVVQPKAAAPEPKKEETALDRLRSKADANSLGQGGKITRLNTYRSTPSVSQNTYEAASKKSAVDSFMQRTGVGKALGAPTLESVQRATPESFVARNTQRVTPENTNPQGVVGAAYGGDVKASGTKYIDAQRLAQQPVSASNAFAANLYSSLGVSNEGLVGAIFDMLDKLGLEEYSQMGHEVLSGVGYTAQKGQQEHPVASTAGSIAGNVALMQTVGAPFNGINAAPLAKSVIAGAGTVGGTSALQNIGNLTSGRQSLGEYSGHTALSAAGGAIGAGLSYGIGQAGVKLAKAIGSKSTKHAANYILNNPAYNVALGGTKAAGFAAGSTGSRELYRAVTEDDYEPDWNQIGESAATSFAFGALTETVNILRTNAQNRAIMAAETERLKQGYSALESAIKQMQNDPSHSPEDVKAAAEKVMTLSSNMYDYYNNVHIVGAQKEIEAALELLANVNAVASQYVGNVAASATPASSPAMLAGSTGDIGVQPQSPIPAPSAPSTNAIQNSEPKLDVSQPTTLADGIAAAEIAQAAEIIANAQKDHAPAITAQERGNEAEAANNEASKQAVTNAIKNELAAQGVPIEEAEAIAQATIPAVPQPPAEELASAVPAANEAQVTSLSPIEQRPSERQFEAEPVAVNTEDLQRMANTLGESGSKAMMGAYDGSRNAVDFAADFTRVYNAAMNDKAIPDTGLSPAQRQAAIFAGQNDAKLNAETEGINNGRQEISLRNGSEWNDGENTGGPVRELEEGSGRDSGWEAQSRPADSEATGLKAERKVSSSELFDGGVTGDSVWIVDSDSDTESTRRAKELAKEYGLEPTFYVGGFLSAETADGRAENIRGCISGNQVFVRADDPNFTADQIIKHEYGHKLIAQGKIDLEDVKYKLDSSVPGGRQEAVARYASAYEGSGMTEDEIFEEIVCDANADMNIFRKVDTLAPVQSEFNEAVKQATEVKETNQARAPNGGLRFSRVGTDGETGKPMYRSNFALGTPKSVKGHHILDLIQNIWSRKPISLTVYENGSPRKIVANYDPTYKPGEISDATKLMGGNRHGNKSEQRVTLNLADDYHEILSEAKYNYSKAEEGKPLSTHEGVKTWHYFVNNILYQESEGEAFEPYTVSINIKEKDDGAFVYSYSAERQNKTSTSGTLHAPISQTGDADETNARSSDINIPSGETSVNEIVERFGVSKADAAPAVEAINGFKEIQLEMDLAGLLNTNKVQTVFDAFTRELIYNGGVDFVGRTFKDVNELAVAASVFRDPRFETMRYFFVDENGKVVLNTGVSSQIPNAAAIYAGKNGEEQGRFVSETFNRALQLGAAKVYTLHNHPSGDTTPSGADFAAMRSLAAFAHQGPIEFGESIIIDHGKYTLFGPNGNAQQVFYDYGKADPMLNLGTTISSAAGLVDVAKSVNAERDDIVLIFSNAKGKTTGIQKIAGEFFKDYDSFKQYLHDEGVKFGSVRTFASVHDASQSLRTMVGKAYENSLLTDAVIDEATISQYGIPQKKTGDAEYAGREHVGEVRFSRAAAIENDSEGNKLTGAQREFFKDSKVLDDDGNLLVVYHGTYADFTVFDRTKGRSNMDIQGSFFSPWDIDAGGYGPNVKAYYLNLKNPAPEGVAYKALNRFKGQNNAGIKAREYLESLGYDGVNNGGEEYIAFNSEQIKLTTNKNPSSNPDTRFSRAATDEKLERLAEQSDSTRQLIEDYKALQKDLAKQTSRAERAEGQMKLTEKPTVREADVKKLAKERIAGVGSDVNANEITKRMTELGNFIVRGGVDGTLTYEDIKERAVDIARDIVSEAKELTNSPELETVKKIRQYLKGKKFYFDNTIQWRKNAVGYKAGDTSQAGEFTDYKNLRAKNLGRFTLVTDPNATQIDDAWAEMQQMFGEEWFPEDVTTIPGMITHISELLDNVEPIYDNPFSYDMAEVIEYEANAMIDGLISDHVRQTAPTYADKMQRKLDQQKYHEAEALRRVRESRDQQIQAVKDHYKQVAADKRARKEDSAARTRLLKIAKRLNNTKMTAANRALLNEYIGDLDLLSKSITGKSVEKLTEIRDWYENRAENDPDFIRDEHIEKAIKRLSQRHISELTQGEVAELTEVLLNIENEIRTEKKLIDSKVKHDVAVAGAQIISDVEGSRGSKGGAWDSYVATELMTPEREAKRITGYNENDPLLTATKELSAGQRKMFDYQRRANERFTKWVQDKKFVQSIAGKKAREITITGSTNDGTVQVKITPAMRMSLYLHSLNDQNLKHIAQGGITIPDIELYKKGDMQKALDKGVTIRLSPSQVREITGQMTNEERAFALAAHDYFNGMSRNEINAVSEQLKGYSLAGVENYFPINTDKKFLKKEFDSIKMDGTIEGMGFLKERVNSANPIMLRDMNEVLDSSIKQHSKYVGLAIAVRNFGKLWNASTGGLDQEGNWNSYGDSVQKAIARKWGDNATNYVERMMADLNNTSSKREVWGSKMSKIRSNYAGAVLEMNAGVAVKQAASYPTAAAVVGWGPLMKALANPTNNNVNLDRVAKYTPLLWYRSQGFSSQELGDIKNQGKSLPKALNWIQAMDVWTTTKLWTAAEYYVRDNTDLKQGSDAYYTQVADVYNRIIEETQPNYTTMQRPQLLRSENELVKTVNMFKTQPFQNFNIIYDAVGELRAKKAAYTVSGTAEAEAAYKAAKKNAALAISSQAVSAMVFALMQFAWDSIRGKDDKYKDDEGDETLTSWLKGMGLNMLSNGAGMLPYGGFILEFAETATDKVLKEMDKDPLFDATFYGLEASPLETVNSAAESTIKLISATASLAKGISSEDEDPNYETYSRTLYDTIESFAQLTGVPIENVRKDLEAVAYQALRKAKGPLLGKYYSTRITSDPAKYPGDYYDLLYRAKKNDPEVYRQIYDLLLSDEAFGGNAAGEVFTEKKIQSAMETRMKKEQGVSSVKDLDQRYLAPSQQGSYDSTLDSLQGSSIWKRATEEQRGKALDALYNISAGTDTGAKKQEAIKASGLSEIEYLLYMTALEMSDANANGSYDSEETEAAIRMMNISDSKKDALWSQKYKSAAPNW